MTTTTRKIIVTSALPYANGSIHLGHLVEYIQTDIWVRFQKLCGNECLYMCADDTHGTAIMLSAQKAGITPETLIANMHQEHSQDFREFLIEFDNYYTTHSPENKELAEFVYNSAHKNNAIEEREIEQMYCGQCQIFLPDRFIRGTCPTCQATDQYGDNCEKCSATYNPTDLIAPRCAECGTAPIVKKTPHLFFKLSAFTQQIKNWLSEKNIQSEIKNKLDEWFEAGLRDWDISRDAPYFGFQIPGHPNKYFYVWLDAPIGYIASTKNWCQTHQRSLDEIWKSGTWEIHHFIGKDILYFHTLFWPAMLLTSGFQLPDSVHVHGFLTINGEKMSKSRGTFINARQYLNHLPPEYLRYYYASKLSNTIEDIDLGCDDFVFKVNADIVNKVVNIGSRLGSVLNKKLDGKLSEPDEKGTQLLEQLLASKPLITECYETLEYHKAVREIMRLADLANHYIDEQAPWSVAKENPEKAAQICTAGLNALRILVGYLKPILPAIAAKTEAFLNIPPITWPNLSTPILHHPIREYEHMAKRIELKDIEQVFAS